MLHACVEKFDVTDSVGKMLGTKRGLKPLQLHLHQRTTRHTLALSPPRQSPASPVRNERPNAEPADRPNATPPPRFRCCLPAASSAGKRTRTHSARIILLPPIPRRPLFTRGNRPEPAAGLPAGASRSIPGGGSSGRRGNPPG